MPLLDILVEASSRRRSCGVSTAPELMPPRISTPIKIRRTPRTDVIELAVLGVVAGKSQSTCPRIVPRGAGDRAGGEAPVLRRTSACRPISAQPSRAASKASGAAAAQCPPKGTQFLPGYYAAADLTPTRPSSAASSGGSPSSPVSPHRPSSPHRMPMPVPQWFARDDLPPRTAGASRAAQPLESPSSPARPSSARPSSARHVTVPQRCARLGRDDPTSAYSACLCAPFGEASGQDGLLLTISPRLAFDGRPGAHTGAALAPEGDLRAQGAALAAEEIRPRLAAVEMSRRPASAMPRLAAVELAADNTGEKTAADEEPVEDETTPRLAAEDKAEVPSPPKGPSRAELRAAARAKAAAASETDPVALKLTARPHVNTVRGLEGAVAEAKLKVGPRPTPMLLQLVEAAQRELDETRDEFRRCATAREQRRLAFCKCEPIRQALRQLVEAAKDRDDDVSKTGLLSAAVDQLGSAAAASSSSSSSAPPSAAEPPPPSLRRSHFVDVHLGLAREGFLSKAAVGTELCRPPYAWALPGYIRYLRTRDGNDADAAASGDTGGGEISDDESDGGDGGDAPSKSDAASMSLFEQGLKLWKGLVKRKKVKNGLLPLEALVEAAFELADALIAQTHAAVLWPFKGDRTVYLREYLSIVRRVVDTLVTTVPVDAPPIGAASATATPRGASAENMPPRRASEVPTPRQAADALQRRLSEMLPSLATGSGVTAAVTAGGKQQAAGGPPTACLGRRGSGSSSSVFGMPGERRNSLSSASAVAAPDRATAVPAGPRLRHAWPSGVGQLSELSRKLGMLQAAVIHTAGEGGAASVAPARAFAAYCQKVGRGTRGSLSYEDLDRAWRHMGGNDYDSLTFRHTIATRPSISRGCQQVLTDAKCADTEQTICLMKVLDRDCDGRISEKDFSYTMAHCHTPVWRASTLMMMEERWHAAAVALEKVEDETKWEMVGNKFIVAKRGKKSAS